MKNNRVGERFRNKEDLGGYEFIIVEYNNCHDVVVEFQDQHKARVHTQYGNCKKGLVKNPYFTSVYGVGCLGEGDFVTGANGKHTKEYRLWKSMLERCYTGKYPTYANVTVCNRWLVYANFLEDLPLIENYDLWLNSEEKMGLDKDLKQVGVENKVYSLDTVKFISASENSREANERRWSKQ